MHKKIRESRRKSDVVKENSRKTVRASKRVAKKAVKEAVAEAGQLTKGFKESPKQKLDDAQRAVTRDKEKKARAERQEERAVREKDRAKKARAEMKEAEAEGKATPHDVRRE